MELSVVNKVVVLCGAVVSLGVIASGAVAAEPGFYVAGSVGYSTYDGSKSDLDQATTETFDAAGYDIVEGDSDFDKKVLGLGLGAGYRFSPYFAAEVAYLTLGEAKYDADLLVTDGVDDYEAGLGLDARVTGPALSLLGSWPVTQSFSLDVRAGVFLSRTKVKLSASIDGSSESISDSEGDTTLHYGVGGTWYYSSGLATRFGYTVFKDALGGEDDVSQFWVGLQYSFAQ